METQAEVSPANGTNDVDVDALMKSHPSLRRRMENSPPRQSCTFTMTAEQYKKLEVIALDMIQDHGGFPTQSSTIRWLIDTYTPRHQVQGTPHT